MWDIYRGDENLIFFIFFKKIGALTIKTVQFHIQTVKFKFK
jgi:hypothetical protein